MKKKSIKNFTLLFLATSLFFSCRNPKVNSDLKQTVSGNVMTNAIYCGGAAPTPEIMERLKKPIPYSNKKFYLQKQSNNYSEQNIILNFTSDSLGQFMFQVKTGTYALFIEEQINPVDISNYENIELNERCYQEWRFKPFKIINVTEDNINNIELRIPKR